MRNIFFKTAHLNDTTLKNGIKKSVRNLRRLNVVISETSLKLTRRFSMEVGVFQNVGSEGCTQALPQASVVDLAE
jgi:hypothetical protein